MLVFIATLRPFTEIDVSATLSGADPRPGLELERDARILPVTCVPALNTVAPLATTFWSTRAVKVLPTGSLSEIWLVVRTVSAVPAGIVAASEDEAAKQAKIIPTTAMNLFMPNIIFNSGLEHKYQNLCAVFAELRPLLLEAVTRKQP